jgi:cysteinyl-tRNA synthetase
MTLRFFDSRIQTKIDFVPMEEGKVSMYCCGVTVYDMSHIGHARCYVAFDAVIRYLRYLKYEVTVVRNYTDVDDKIIKRAAELGEEIKTLTERFIKEYEYDMKQLDVARADVEPKVTEHIPEIIDMVTALIERDHAYENDGDVYFAVDSFDDYCSLSKRNLEDCRAGASERTSSEELSRKKSPLDFALWKKSNGDELGWDSPWGFGRPGWHIECSAMSTKYLTNDFDIHTGGQDLIFPHHENEIAQSVCAAEGQYAHHWMHNGFVNIDSEKMSKSLDNFFTIRNVIKLFHPQVLRFFLLSTQYRSPINYSDTNLREATRRVFSIYSTLEAMDTYLAERAENHKQGPIMLPKLIDGIIPEFEEAMNDDFCTPRAIACLSEPITQANALLSGKEKGGRYATISAMREKFRIVADALCVFHENPSEILSGIQDRILLERELDPTKIDDLVNQRNQARSERDFAKADELRDTLVEMNVQLMDSPTGTTWRLIP